MSLSVAEICTLLQLFHRSLDAGELCGGKCVEYYRTVPFINRHQEHKNRLVLLVFAREFELVEQFEEETYRPNFFGWIYL